MAVEVIIPKMSDHMERGTIIRWLVKEGNAVKRGQVLLELETDKAVGEVESPADGVLKGLRAGDGDEVPVGETVAFVAEPGETIPVVPPLNAQTAMPSHHTAPEMGEVAGGSAIIPATPVARRIAREMGIDLHQVKGSGPGGSVREADIRAYAESQKPPKPTTLTHIQKTTGERMVEAARSIPHFFLQVDVDMTHVLELREELAEQMTATTGYRASITAILVHVTAAALKKHPYANASFENGNPQAQPHINIGIAVGAQDGLVVPVIHDADRLTLAEINRQVRDFEGRKAGLRFSPAELAGGTFTISNLGMYGIDRFSAIINPPQSAILALGRIARQPVALADDSIQVRPVMTLTLSGDHRSLDGVQASQFLADIKALIESRLP